MSTFANGISNVRSDGYHWFCTLGDTHYAWGLVDNSWWMGTDKDQLSWDGWSKIAHSLVPDPVMTLYILTEGNVS